VAFEKFVEPTRYCERCCPSGSGGDTLGLSSGISAHNQDSLCVRQGRISLFSLRPLAPGLLTKSIIQAAFFRGFTDFVESSRS